MANQAIVTINDKQWPASLAITYAELTTGLRGLPSLPAGTGMLFVLPRDQAVTVTTRGMLISIDIVFISGQLEVVDVALGVSPDLLVSESMPVRYFLEVNAGEAEGIAVGDVVSISVSQTVTEAGVGDGISPVVTFAGMMMVGAFMAKMGKVMADAVFPKKTLLYGPRGERLWPQTTRHKPTCPKCGSAKTYPSMGKRWFCNDCKHRWVPYLPQTKKHKPTRHDVEIGTWAERDRIGIWITDKRTGKSIAEWWDEDAEEMFEQGFFKRGDIRHQTIIGEDFEESVLDYAESAGLLVGSRKYLPQTARSGYYWTGINKDTGEIAESFTPYTSSGRALKGGKAFASRSWKGDRALVEVWDRPNRYSEHLKIEPVASELLGGRKTAVIPDEPSPRRRTAGELEFLPDSLEFLAYTIDDIGYRDKIDTAFQQAIARAKGR